MQVPRGRFSAVKKGMRVCDLLRELEHSRFSGYCVITRGTETGSLVLKNGNCLLVDYENLTGEDAWLSFQYIEEREIDAQLMHLTPAQLDLALEFNQGARIERRKKQRHGAEGGTVPVHGMTEELGSRPGSPPVMTDMYPEEVHANQKSRGAGPVQVKPGQDQDSDNGTGISLSRRGADSTAPSLPADITPGTHESSPPPVREPVPKTPVPPVLDEPGAAQGPADRSGFPESTPVPAREGKEEKSPNAGFIRELAALDAMDLQSMTEKIRMNCRTIVQGLHLEHLLEQQEDKNHP
jgi:hypothetical protein